MGHGFLCITDAGCILNFESPSPFWFPAGQDLLDSSQLCVGIVYKGAILNNVITLFRIGDCGCFWFCCFVLF